MNKVFAGITAGCNEKLTEKGKGTMRGLDMREPHIDIRTESHTVIMEGDHIVRRPDDSREEDNWYLKD